MRALRPLGLGLGPGGILRVLGPEVPRQGAVVEVGLVAEGAAEASTAAAALAGRGGTGATWAGSTCALVVARSG